MARKFQIWYARSDGGMRLEMLLVPYSVKDRNVYIITMHLDGYWWSDATFRKLPMNVKLQRLMRSGHIAHVVADTSSLNLEECRTAICAEAVYKHIRRKTRNCSHGACHGWSTNSKMRDLYTATVNFRKLFAWYLFA